MPAVRRRELWALAAFVALSWAIQQWWVGHRAAGLGPQVATLARPGDIRMLSSVTCAVCTKARLWFTEHRVPFTECKIETDSACLAEHRALGAGGTPIIIVRGSPTLGFSADALLARLQPRAPGG
jgi:glutaredoxin